MEKDVEVMLFSVEDGVGIQIRHDCDVICEGIAGFVDFVYFIVCFSFGFGEGVIYEFDDGIGVHFDCFGGAGYGGINCVIEEGEGV